MGIGLKIKEFRKEKKLTQEEFASMIGVDNSQLSKIERDILAPTIPMLLEINSIFGISLDSLLLNNYPEYESSINAVSEPVALYGTKQIHPDTQNIPLYDIEAAAGIVSLFNDTHNNPIDHIRIPGIPKCDGAIPISGDSMYPLLKSGDIVLYKQVAEPLNAIYFFGEMYIIGIGQDGDDYVVVKYIHKSDKGDDYIKLVSQNQHHDPIDIPKKSIRALAIVRASIRINSMK